MYHLSLSLTSILRATFSIQRSGAWFSRILLVLVFLAPLSHLVLAPLPSRPSVRSLLGATLLERRQAQQQTKPGPLCFPAQSQLRLPPLALGASPARGKQGCQGQAYPRPRSAAASAMDLVQPCQRGPGARTGGHVAAPGTGPGPAHLCTPGEQPGRRCGRT